MSLSETTVERRYHGDDESLKPQANETLGGMDGLPLNVEEATASVGQTDKSPMADRIGHQATVNARPEVVTTTPADPKSAAELLARLTEFSPETAVKLANKFLPRNRASTGRPRPSQVSAALEQQVRADFKKQSERA